MRTVCGVPTLLWTARRAALALGLLLAATGCASESSEAPKADAAVSTDAQGGDAQAADSQAGADATGGADGSDTAAVSYPVGVAMIETQGPGGRTLPITVWYPAAPGGQGAAVSYLLGQIPSPAGALQDVAPAKGPFPLIAFSHGNQGVREQSVFLCEALAKAGYVVASPDHVLNTFLDFDQALFPVMVLWRPKDISATIDRLLTPAEGEGWLQGLVDPERIGVTGHSFGGYTALAVAGAVLDPPEQFLPTCTGEPKPGSACEAIAQAGPKPWNLGDPRVKISIPLAHCLTAGFDPNSLAKLPIPVIVQAATDDDTCDFDAEAVTTFETLQPPKALVAIQGGHHFTYSDICAIEFLLPPDRKAQFAGVCGPEASPPLSKAHPLITEFALATFDIYLKGNDAKRALFAPTADPTRQLVVQSQGIVAP